MNSNDTSPGSARPSIIDLEAETIVDDATVMDKETSSPPPPPPPTAKRRSGRWLWPALALGVAAIAGGWLYKDLLASYFPSEAMQQAVSRIDTLEAQTKTLNDQLTALANQSEQLKGTIASSQSTAAKAGTAAQDAATKAVDLESRMATVEGATQGIKADLAKLANAPSPVLNGPADAAALAALAQRLDAVEKDLASLKAQRVPDDQAAVTSALSQALSDVKAKIAAGAPYQPEYERIARMVPAAAGLDVLKSRAAEGLPNAKGLAAELRNQISLLPKPEAVPESDDGYLSSLWGALSSVVTVKNIGEADLPAVAGRAAELADAGDLTGAIAVIDGTEGEKPMILTQWRARVEARLALDQALQQTSTAVMQQITSMGATQ